MTLVTVKMGDQSTPDKSVLPSGTKIVAGYLGKAGATPHVWTRTQWNMFNGLKKLPIWTPDLSRDLNSVDAQADAESILWRCYTLGIPQGSPIAIDLETKVFPSYCTALSSYVRYFGYRVWLYGSASTVFRNPVNKNSQNGANKYWVAEYHEPRKAYMYDHPDVAATQWTDGPEVDQSTVKEWEYHHALKEW